MIAYLAGVSGLPQGGDKSRSLIVTMHVRICLNWTDTKNRRQAVLGESGFGATDARRHGGFPVPGRGFADSAVS